MISILIYISITYSLGIITGVLLTKIKRRTEIPKIYKDMFKFVQPQIPTTTGEITMGYYKYCKEKVKALEELSMDKQNKVEMAELYKVIWLFESRKERRIK